MELRCILKAVFVAYCILLCEIHANADVSCIAGKYIAGSQGLVRCDFGIDVTKDQHDFNVVRYDFSISLDSRKSLLACTWNQGKMECPFIAPGYEFDDRVDSTLTLTIPVVDKSMTGLYRCQLVNKPTKNIAMHFCNLTVIEESSCEPTRTLTDTLTVNSNSSTESEPVVPATPFIVLSIIFFIVIVALCLFSRKEIWTLLRRLRTGEHSPEETMRDADIPLMDISRHVEYPKNARHKPTQVYIDTTDKSIQFGNEMGVRRPITNQHNWT